MSERVTVSITDGVADVRMNRPEKMNAIDPAMFEGLSQMGLELAKDRSLRAVVLSGEGRAFCAGLDFMSFQAMADSSRGSSTRNVIEQDTSSPANLAQRAAYIWTELPVPVIAAVHGVAFGGGLQIAMGADIRFITPDARMSIMEIKWGLVPDMSGTQTLRRLVPLDVIKELTFTGRVISGTEAVELGLATHVSDTPFESAMELAREIAARSPDAVRAGKKLLNASALVSLEEGLRMEAELQKSLIGQPNQVEAVQANIQKRDPNFKDPE
ncbi:MAG: crotonase/enoyl-CoA hydratase family protein [Deltaproteobacteria bacterium]|nr:crotonase/enoyl-CoA hydratase family protein [Deltaproteobacteria bacterium]MBW2053082.1 crotonase/enoyl-CoA hydratase family protein [Deltaproteobacteria bacterium]MBW2140391.1 crotonase/enoyl-CoA hydratase family protein [Deltaproteobacteria bacterium]MBW2322811.1 crotonase/enoyl-CoA hydratase family protein [Deltaproteobacteria bacterium]